MRNLLRFLTFPYVTMHVHVSNAQIDPARSRGSPRREIRSILAQSGARIFISLQSFPSSSSHAEIDKVPQRYRTRDGNIHNDAAFRDLSYASFQSLRNVKGPHGPQLYMVFSFSYYLCLYCQTGPEKVK